MRLIDRKRTVGVVAMRANTSREHSRIENSLRGAIRSDGVHRVRSIADESDATFGPVVKGRDQPWETGTFPEQLEATPGCRASQTPSHRNAGKIIEISSSVPIFAFEKFAVVSAVLGDEVDKLLSVVEVAMGRQQTSGRGDLPTPLFGRPK